MRLRDTLQVSALRVAEHFDRMDSTNQYTPVLVASLVGAKSASSEKIRLPLFGLIKQRNVRAASVAHFDLRVHSSIKCSGFSTGHGILQYRAHKMQPQAADR
jgi:hypothetical protein